MSVLLAFGFPSIGIRVPRDRQNDRRPVFSVRLSSVTSFQDSHNGRMHWFWFFGGLWSSPFYWCGCRIATNWRPCFWGLPVEYYSVLSVATMAAVGASVIGAPITVVLIVIELTQSYQYGLMALLSVTISSKLTYQMFGLSFFDRQLLDRGIDMTRGREYIHLSQTFVRELESSDYLEVDPQSKQSDTLKSIRSKQMTEAYVADSNGTFLGKLSLLDLEDSDDPVSLVMDKNPVTLHPDNSLNPWNR